MNERFMLPLHSDNNMIVRLRSLSPPPSSPLHIFGREISLWRAVLHAFCHLEHKDRCVALHVGAVASFVYSGVCLEKLRIVASLPICMRVASTQIKASENFPNVSFSEITSQPSSCYRRYLKTSFHPSSFIDALTCYILWILGGGGGRG